MALLPHQSRSQLSLHPLLSSWPGSEQEGTVQEHWTPGRLCTGHGLRRCHSALPLFPLNTDNLWLAMLNEKGCTLVKMKCHFQALHVTFAIPGLNEHFWELDFSCSQGVHHSTDGKKILLHPNYSLLFLLFCNMLSNEDSPSINVHFLSPMFNAVTFKNLLLYKISS